MSFTEDDTFRILRRLPYPDLKKGLADIAFSIDDRRDAELCDIVEIQDFCKKNNWTVQEFEEVFNREQKNTWLKIE